MLCCPEWPRNVFTQVYVAFYKLFFSHRLIRTCCINEKLWREYWIQINFSVCVHGKGVTSVSQCNSPAHCAGRHWRAQTGFVRLVHMRLIFVRCSKAASSSTKNGHKSSSAFYWDVLLFTEERNRTTETLTWVCVCLPSTASQWQLGQDSVWVQDTENSKTSYCGSCPRGHWRPRSRVRHRHRARVLLVRAIAGMRRGQSWDCWTDSWHAQPRCTYKYWELLRPCGKIFIMPFWPSSRHRRFVS